MNLNLYGGQPRGARVGDQGLRKRCVSGESHAALMDAEADNATLVDELENMNVLLEENTYEMERLREILEERGDENGCGGTSTVLKRRVQELEGDNKNLRAKLEEQDEVILQRKDEKADLADEVEAFRLDIKEMQCRRDAESIERSQSHAQILEEREKHDAVEDDFNSLRDKLAAATIDLQQKEDEIEMKVRRLMNWLANAIES
jgi:chromosome segregation ATPase